MQLKSILCPIDFSEFSIAAYQHAVSLAEYYRAKLVPLHVVELWKHPFSEYAAAEADFANFSDAMSEAGEGKLKRFVSEFPNEKVAPELAVMEGNASDCILSLAQERNFELIVMGTHGGRGFDRLVLGSVTDHVIRKAPCPVLVASDRAQVAPTARDGSRPLRRVLYCTDFSSNSERALGYAVSVAAEYGSELALMHVAEDAADRAKADAIVAQRTAELDKLISEDERKGLSIRSVVRFGKAYEEIVQHAKDTDAHLIVLGTRGGGLMDRAVFGSTTYRVIQLGPCPVLTIHT